jgi:putative ATPase
VDDPEPDDAATMSLFGEAEEPEEAGPSAPLAARMRPRALEEFVGQEHLLHPGAALRTMIERDTLQSMILFGPAGTGKSSLALLIAHRTKAQFETFSAVTSGVADVRRVIKIATQRRKAEGRRSILFVDEIHRFNKAQQDAFLPHVEDGTIILIGSTTENPFFSVTSPLLSRCRLFTFEPLTPEHVGAIVRRALEDRERGLGALGVEMRPEALDHLLNISGGDARAALNGLETAVEVAREGGGKPLVIEVGHVEEAVQRRLLAYDKAGDMHYDVASAFIKSMRGSDPDAALHWLARMIKAGEDPRFIARRIIIQAAEDVGNADPMALLVATAAAHAVEYVGLPEAQIPLAQATIYVATAPKSNASYLGIARAMEDIEQRIPPPVPRHLRGTGYGGAARLGSGEGYLYPHEYPGHFIPQEYLPPDFKSQNYYEPSDQGLEREIAERLRRWRERLEGEGG